MNWLVSFEALMTVVTHSKRRDKHCTMTQITPVMETTYFKMDSPLRLNTQRDFVANIFLPLDIAAYALMSRDVIHQKYVGAML